MPGLGALFSSSRDSSRELFGAPVEGGRPAANPLIDKLAILFDVEGFSRSTSRSMWRLFVERETINTFFAQCAFAPMLILGLALGNRAVVAISAVGLCINWLARRSLVRLGQALRANSATRAHAIRDTIAVYAAVGVSWASTMWPLVSHNHLHFPPVLLGIIGSVAMVVMATTNCYAPRVFRSALFGFYLSTAIFVPLYSAHPIGLLVSGYVLLLLVCGQLATATHRQMESLILAHHRRSVTIAQLRRSRNAISRLASTDSLSRLPNRQAFLDYFDQLAARSEEGGFTLIVFDLDLFKNINDALGHHVGDSVLAGVGERLCEVHRMGLFAARLGGDEFAVVIPREMSANAAERYFRLVQRRISRINLLGESSYPIGATGGGAVYPRDGSDRTSLLTAADFALRQAKRGQRGTFRMYQRRLLDQFTRESEIATALASALRDGAFRLVYQPQIDMHSGLVVGAEGLTRFTRAPLAAADVNEVFEIAEERGLGPSLSNAVFRRAIDDAANLLERLGGKVPLAINLSRSQLKAPQAVLSVLRQWARRGLNPALIKLEVTEDAIAGRGAEQSLDVLNTIHAMGFRISLDDFGTGSSSLTHLRDLPISELKVDRSFVQDIAHSRRDRAIVSCSRTLCTCLEIECLVEGVETLEQSAWLAQMGVRHVQGYLYSQPLLPDDLVRFAAEQRIAAEGEPLQPGRSAA